MKLLDICNHLEIMSPLSIQESYDNSGLIIGDREQIINGALVSVDVTEDIINEAIKRKCNLIISHHPIIFKGLKRITGSGYVERIILSAIKNDIAIYAMHTNLDNIKDGVSGILAKKLGLKNVAVLSPKRDLLRKLVTFCPEKNADEVRNALFEAGGGVIGNSDSCSFTSPGMGSFRALDGTNPYVGRQGEVHFENEKRLEIIYPVYKEKDIIQKLILHHPYEEVAYDIYSLNNEFKNVGLGVFGELENPISEDEFLKHVKDVLKCSFIRHTDFIRQKVKKVAVCGGSGSFMIQDAINAGAQVFISADFKYHDFFEADNRILIGDVGHYESEQFAKELIRDILLEKFPTFAVLLTERDTNPINYL